MKSLVNKENQKYVVAGVAAILVIGIMVLILGRCSRKGQTQEEGKQDTQGAMLTTEVQTEETVVESTQETDSQEESTEEVAQTEQEQDQADEQEIAKNQQQKSDQSQQNNQQNVPQEIEQEVSADWVSDLSVVGRTAQLIIVSANGSRAEVSMHEKDGNGEWQEIMSASGYVGSHGVGNASEYDTKTPTGVYSLTRAFGVNGNPGSGLPYTQVDDADYWVDDPSSAYYNQFVSTDEISADWDSAEHIIDYPTQYAYAIAIDYNTQCTPGAGSAIFFHCSNGSPTAGCVAIPQSKMVYVLTHIRSGCLIVIDTQDNIENY